MLLPSRQKGKHQGVEPLQVHMLSWLEERNQEMDNPPLTAFRSCVQEFKTHISFKNVPGISDAGVQPQVPPLHFTFKGLVSL